MPPRSTTVLSAATVVAALWLSGCAAHTSDKAATTTAPAPTTTVAPAPQSAPLPDPAALTDLLGRLADPAVPGTDKLPLVEGATAGDAATLDNFTKALQDNHMIPLTFTATNVNLAYTGGATNFDLFVDAGTAVGNGTQLRISYDLTGDGTVDRVETYRYFATDPVTGYEHYTQGVTLLSSSGTLGNLANGTVRAEVWNAIGNNPSTLGTGNQSVLKLPYS